MDQRNSVLEDSKKEIQLVDGIDDDVSAYTIAPIVANGDPIGAVVLFSKERSMGEVEHKAAETADWLLSPSNGTLGLIILYHLDKKKECR